MKFLVVTTPSIYQKIFVFIAYSDFFQSKTSSPWKNTSNISIFFTWYPTYKQSIIAIFSGCDWLVIFISKNKTIIYLEMTCSWKKYLSSRPSWAGKLSITRIHFRSPWIILHDRQNTLFIHQTVTSTQKQYLSWCG